MNFVKFLKTVVSDAKDDYTWNRAASLTVKGGRALPLSTAHYLIDKLPIIGWLPKYNYRWLISDVIAGLTIGLMLIPQGLSYAKIAKIPVEYGLMSSWFPPGLYAFMGTTKGGLSADELRGLITNSVIRSLYWSNIPYRPANLTCC